jgi:hypothetical protein
MTQQHFVLFSLSLTAPVDFVVHSGMLSCHQSKTSKISTSAVKILLFIPCFASRAFHFFVLTLVLYYLSFKLSLASSFFSHWVFDAPATKL